MNIGKIAEISVQTPQSTPKTAVQESAKKPTTLAADNVDKYEEQAVTSYSPAYTKATVAKKQTEKYTDHGIDGVDKPKSFVALKNEQFKKTVADIIGKQSGLAWDAIIKDQEQIENGTIEDYWSADATAERIFGFAKTLAGGDDSKLETLREAFEKGFSQAAGIFSKKTKQDKLPSICYDTYDKVSEMFDKWAAEAKGEKVDTEEKTEPAKTEETK